MKKHGAIALSVLLVAGILSGCSESKPVTNQTSAETNPDGTYQPVLMMDKDKVKLYQITELPCTLLVNDFNIILTGVEAYSIPSGSGHGYYPCIVVRYDRSGLTDDDFYWVNKRDLFEYYSSLDSPQNSEEPCDVSYQGGYYDDKKLTHICFGIQEYKKDFSDASVSISVTLTKDDHSYMNDYSLYSGGYIEIPVKDISEADDDVKKHIRSRLNKLAIRPYF